MPGPGEHKTVQSRILAYAQEIGWAYVPREESERRRGFDPDGTTPEDRARLASLYFDDLLDAQVLAFNPKYKEAEGALVGELRRLNADIAGNREFLTYLRNQGKFFCAEDNRELDLTLIDYVDCERRREKYRNVYEVTEEFYFHNGHYGTREDVVFLINGIPVLAIECKNASKDEAIALGVDQIRRYHVETPEVMVPEMLFTTTEAIGFVYGVTWNTLRRNIFNWKHEQVGNLEAKLKSFCGIPHVLKLLKDYIVFAEQEEELRKYILRQHQAAGVEKVVERALDPKLTRGLIWHTPGKRQDLYDDQVGGAIVQGSRGGETNYSNDDRPERAGRSDAQKSGFARVEQRRTRAQHRSPESAAQKRLSRHRRLDDPKVSGNAGKDQ